MLFCSLPGVSYPPRLWNHQHPHPVRPHTHTTPQPRGMLPKTFVKMGVVVMWVVLIPFASVGAISRPEREGKVDCETGFVSIAGSCYSFPQELRKWERAQEGCRAQGAQLASVLNHQQYTGLLEHINSNYRGTYWTSGAVVSGRWVWTVTGQPMADKWWGVRPSPNPNNCAYFCSDTLRYWSRSCHTTFRYICQKPPRTLQEKEDDSSVEEPDDSQDPGIPEVPEDPDDSQDPGIPDIVEERSDNSYEDVEEVDDGLVIHSLPNRTMLPHEVEVSAKGSRIKYTTVVSSSNHCAASIYLLSMPLLLLLWFTTH